MKISVDDIYATVLVGGKDGISVEEWEDLKDDINDFGISKWKFEDPSLGVDFLDLTLTIEDSNIVSKPYQKPLSLYQNICPNLAHPPWMLKGMFLAC